MSSYIDVVHPCLLYTSLQQAGNRPIALIGGGTTMIGDPSGRTDMRLSLIHISVDGARVALVSYGAETEEIIAAKDLLAQHGVQADCVKPVSYTHLQAPAARRTEVYRRCHEQDRRIVAGRAERHWPPLADGEIAAGPRQRAGHRG